PALVVGRSDKNDGMVALVVNDGGDVGGVLLSVGRGFIELDGRFRYAGGFGGGGHGAGVGGSAGVGGGPGEDEVRRPAALVETDGFGGAGLGVAAGDGNNGIRLG